MGYSRLVNTWFGPSAWVTGNLVNRNFHETWILFLKKGQPGLFFVYFSVFSNKHHFNFYNKYMWKNVHPVYGAGIWTCNLGNVSLFPYPLDQGSRPQTRILKEKFCEGFQRKKQTKNVFQWHHWCRASFIGRINESTQTVAKLIQWPALTKLKFGGQGTMLQNSMTKTDFEVSSGIWL